MDWGVISRNFGFLMGGLRVTFQLAIFALAGGLALGIVLGLCRLSSRRWIYYPATVFVNGLRSIPLLIVIFWFYFALPIMFKAPLTAFQSAVISFIVFESTYFAEIVRAGIQAVPKGQVSAGYSTGLTYFQTMRHIVVPQALRNMVPALVTQSIVIFQDTSLAYVIGVKEFLRRTSLVDARELRTVELYVFAALVYFVLCFIGSSISRRLERRRLH
ncbi:MAG: amino acid ABC transporter permease [bacterium]